MIERLTRVPTRSGLGAVASVTWAVLVAGLGFFAACHGRGPTGDVSPGDPNAGAASVATLPFDLYFPAASGKLRVERRDLPAPIEPAERARALVAALLAGPSSESTDLSAPFPNDVTVGSVYLSASPASVLYVDLVAPTRDLPPASGSLGELLSVYSLVDTVLLNVPEARRCVLLWNSKQLESFAGHVDTASALTADESLIERR